MTKKMKTGNSSRTSGLTHPGAKATAQPTEAMAPRDEGKPQKSTKIPTSARKPAALDESTEVELRVAVLSGPELIGALLSALGSLAGVCYFVGYSYLSGWYETAGVPLLAFNWPWHDVVLRGFSHTQTWGVLQAATAGAAILVTAVYLIGAIVGRALARFVERKSNEKKTVARGNIWWFKPIAFGLIALLCVLFLAVTYQTFQRVFHDLAYREGAHDFCGLYEAVTGPTAPQNSAQACQSRTAQGSKPEPTIAPRLKVGEAIRIGGYKYAMVEVRVLKPEDEPTKPVACGFLLQEAGNRLLLLNRQGLHTFVFGDTPYTWLRVQPEGCKASEPDSVSADGSANLAR